MTCLSAFDFGLTALATDVTAKLERDELAISLHKLNEPRRHLAIVMHVVMDSFASKPDLETSGTVLLALITS